MEGVRRRKIWRAGSGARAATQGRKAWQDPLHTWTCVGWAGVGVEGAFAHTQLLTLPQQAVEETLNVRVAFSAATCPKTRKRPPPTNPTKAPTMPLLYLCCNLFNSIKNLRRVPPFLSLAMAADGGQPPLPGHRRCLGQRLVRARRCALHLVVLLLQLLLLDAGLGNFRQFVVPPAPGRGVGRPAPKGNVAWPGGCDGGFRRRGAPLLPRHPPTLDGPGQGRPLVAFHLGQACALGLGVEGVPGQAGLWGGGGAGPPGAAPSRSYFRR